MEHVNNFVGTLNGILFSDYTVYALLFTGVLFTVWSIFGQYRALTHGVAVVRGKYDDKDDPGAINHFQALSAALSANPWRGGIVVSGRVRSTVRPVLRTSGYCCVGCSGKGSHSIVKSFARPSAV